MEYMQQLIIKNPWCNSYEKTNRMASDREEWRIAINQSQNLIQKKEMCVLISILV